MHFVSMLVYRRRNVAFKNHCNDGMRYKILKHINIKWRINDQNRFQKLNFVNTFWKCSMVWRKKNVHHGGEVAGHVALTLKTLHSIQYTLPYTLNHIQIYIYIYNICFVKKDWNGMSSDSICTYSLYFPHPHIHTQTHKTNERSALFTFH